MGFFSKIADRIFNRNDDDTRARAPAAGKPAPVIFEGRASDPEISPPPRNPASVPAATPTAAPASVDVEVVLGDMAEAKGSDSDWRRSIVDLLKLLDLDSSLAARRELAEELGVEAGAHGSAEQNIALHRAVMRKLAENGGKVPAELRD